MTDADAQAMERASADMLEQIAQAVLPAVSAVELQTDRAGRQIEIVVHHQHFGGLDLPIAQRARYRDAAFIHERGGFEQPHLFVTDANTRGFRVQFVLETETRIHAGSQAINEPEPGVGPGAKVFGARISQTDDKADGGHDVERRGERKPCRHSGESRNPFSAKAAKAKWIP